MTEPGPDEQSQFRLLDQYLEQLHSGRHPDRDALAGQHPELAGALECLDALEGLASEILGGTGEPPPATPATGETVTLNNASASPSSLAMSLPSDFGSYELLEEIGRGGMGVVYKARQKGLDRIVAVKMILAGHLASPEHVRRFQAEAKAAAGLRHANIVDIHEVGELQGRHYFAMEYVDGISLAERLAQGPIGIETAARLVMQVARAVDHLHQQGIVHRDLKPSNILVDAAGRPYVTDFGLAKLFRVQADATTTGAILGTASYMAPEQAAGHSGEATPASDVYSLGAILYELLTGRPPFQAANPMETLLQVLTREPVLPRQLNRNVPRSLELICLKCLSKSPGERYSSAAALADDLERFLKGEALSARPPNPLQRLWIWSRREPALAVRLALLLLFLAVDLAIATLAPLRPGFHREMLIIMAVWALTAIAFQQILKLPRWSLYACFLWGTLDSAFLFTALLAASGVLSPLVIVYPLLIVASGLWFHVRYVWFTCGLCLASYGFHVIHFYAWRAQHDLAAVITQNDFRWDRHVIFAVGLLGISAGVAYLVHRVRVLSSFYGQKP